MSLSKHERRMAKRISKAQFHHITYSPERIVPVFRGEHQVLTLIQRMAYTSAGFLEAIDFELTRLKNKPAIILNQQEILNLRSDRKRKKNEKRKALRAKANSKTVLEKGKLPSRNRKRKTTSSGNEPT